MDARLKNYIICCHADKKLKQEVPVSIYDQFIQAGTALTKDRICGLNDMDDCPDNISDRNQRYSEATAMYWIWKHIDTPYVGIMHYRRRLMISDEQYSELMDEGVDIITSVVHDLVVSIEEDYRDTLYSCDWDLYMEILKRYDPDNYDYYEMLLNDTTIHPCNLGVYRGDIYRELCQWAFPICNEFYLRSPEKTDLYQRRDAGFIMERLTHLFVARKKRDGFKIAEADIVDLRSDKWTPEGECSYSDFDEVYKACNRLYKSDQIIRCNNVMGVALRNGAEKDDRLRTLSELLITSIKERQEIPESMHEYLPKEFRSDIGILIDIWNGLKKIVKLHYDMKNEMTMKKLTEYIELTGFSKVAVREAYLYASQQQ